MKIQLWSVGKNHEEYIQPGVEQFTGRILHYFPVTWKILAPSRKTGVLSVEAIREYESSMILASLSADDYLVLLDENGQSLSSRQLAAFIGERANESCRSLVFLIGGAYGVDRKLRDRARFVWSLSALTLPHQLVRLILAEQLYRACTILRNEKYHHD
jgi:23S rRNA (pseudouridine1915-N3)-methyltransferase